MKAYCLFEQSGTFKKEFIKLGVPAYDIDILNMFGETDSQIDLYEQIVKAYDYDESIFDSINKDDIIFAFFPCIRFSHNAQLTFRCDTPQLKKWDIENKLNYDMVLMNELARNYNMLTKLVIVCIRKGLRLIIENPYSTQHFLRNYWAIKPSVIDMDRTLSGDYMKKPTQYFFINCTPKNNELLDEPIIKEYHLLEKHLGTVKRSMIHPDYANRFIRKYIL